MNAKVSSRKKPIRVAVFSAKKWVIDSFDQFKDKYAFEIVYFEPRLNESTVRLAAGFDAVCVFVNDVVNENVVEQLNDEKVALIALRCAGFNNVDVDAAAHAGVGVVRVPAYSPYAVAEHTVGLILALNRKLHKSYSRVRDYNFALDGLLGFDLNGKTVGVIGTGKIGQIFAKLMMGFGCKILAYDKYPSKELEGQGVQYADLPELYENSDIISLHCPLTHGTYHIINEYAIGLMKKDVMIINTSRGPLIDTGAVIGGLKSGKVGYLGLDVYEEEEELFFEDLSQKVIQDDQFVRLQTFPNVLITAHQAFFTKEAVSNITRTTLENIKEYLEKGGTVNEVKSAKK
jgi:D-lactate dehydrogenase